MAAKKILVPYDFTKNEVQNVLVHLLASDPGSPSEAQLYYDSTNKLIKYHNGTAFVSDTARSRHTGTQTASTISDFDTQVRTNRIDQLTAPSASVSFNSQRITNLAQASADTDAAQWGQVKSLVNGLDWKASAVVAVSTNVTISSPGATLDGVSLSSGDRVVLYGQSTGSQNGLWVWNGAAAAMTRPTDWVTATATGGATVPIEQGTDAEKLVICTTNGAITVDTTSTVWTVMSAGTSYSAGSGLTLASTTFNVGAGTGITVNADDVAIDTTVVARKVTALIGNGSSTALAVTHSLGNQWVTAQVFEVATLKQVEVDITLTDANTTTFTFAVAPASNAYRVVIIG